MSNRNTGDILVVGPSWVGDMVMAQTLFKILKQKYPQSAIDVLAPAWSQPLLERMPEVRNAVTLPFGHGELKLGARMTFGKSLKAHSYQSAYVLPNSLKSALIPFFADIPRRVGWRGEMRFFLLNDIRLLDKKRYPLMIQRFAALAYPSGKTLPDKLPRPTLHVHPDEISRKAETYQLTLERPVLALCPGAEFGPSKRWPAHYYGEIAASMIGRGWQVWLFGSASDAEVAEEIASTVDESGARWCRTLAGKTSLADAIDLLAAASVVVSNDSGLMHIAAALNRPLIAVYGSTSPGFTPPLTNKATIISSDAPCSPCFERDCPLTRADEKMHCMLEVTPDRVFAAIDQLDMPMQEPG